MTTAAHRATPQESQINPGPRRSHPDDDGWPTNRREFIVWHNGRTGGLADGYQLGRRAAIEQAAEERARQLLHDQAVEFSRLAYTEALRRHGPHWASMFDRTELTS